MSLAWHDGPAQVRVTNATGGLLRLVVRAACDTAVSAPRCAPVPPSLHVADAYGDENDQVEREARDATRAFLERRYPKRRP